MEEQKTERELREEILRLRKLIAGLTPDIDSMLRCRGLYIYKKEPQDDLLLPDPDELDVYYNTLKKYSFRLLLRDIIKFQQQFTARDVCRFAAPEVVQKYINYLQKVGLIKIAGEGIYRLAKGRIRSFGATLEWFLAEVFKREFQCEAIWGVTFKKVKSGGDYDLLAKVNGSLLYMEVKSSPPKQVYDREIAAFLDRFTEFRPDIGVFYMDTELRMKDKIVPMFEEELQRRQTNPPRITRLERELFQVHESMYIINAQKGIAGNIATVLRHYFVGG
jgi:hypothetical protein